MIWGSVKGAVEQATSPAVSVRVPLPARLAERPPFGVIGRQDEIADLSQAYKDVAESEGGRRIVLISGEAGVGKSALTAQVAAECHALGASVLLGRCTEDLGAPYGPFVEAIAHYFAHQPNSAGPTTTYTHGAEVARFLAPLQRYFGDLPSVQSSDPETDRYLLFSAVVGLFAAISLERPLVLILEDLHWADKPSLQLLRHLVASGDRMRLLVIGTFRDAELAATHPLTDTLAALRREPDVHRLRLGGLSDDGVIAYLEAAAGGELNRAAVTLAQAIYHETDGNPFFVGEVLRHLVDTGDIVNDGGTLRVSSSDHGHISLPDSVREVVGARVNRLGTTSSRLLSLASIIGREFDVALLCKVADVSEDDAIDLLDEIVETDLIRELTDAPGRYNFSHALIQHTLYEDMGPTRRARGHRRVGEALESTYARNVGEHLAELAHHWFNATQPSDVDKAVSYSRQAGEAALQRTRPGRCGPALHSSACTRRPSGRS